MPDIKPPEITLWETWKKTPSRDNLSPLLDHFDTIINKRVNQFNTAEVPRPAMLIEAKKLAVDAFKSFNPKEASLATHTYTHLKRLGRYVGDIQNIGRIPENRRLKITEYNIARAKLEEDLGGRAPSMQELAEKLKWSIKEVERMESELRGSSISGATSAFGADLIYGAPPTKEKRIVRNIYYELDPEEQVVYEYLLGMGGKPKLSEGEIAKKLKVNVTKVSRIKKRIANKVERWL